MNYPLDIDGISQQLAYLASVAYGITIDPGDVSDILMATMSRGRGISRNALWLWRAGLVIKGIITKCMIIQEYRDS